MRVVAVVREGDHWLPLWFVPAGCVLVIHTFDDVVDYDIFDGKLRWIGLQLGFDETVVHRVPNGLPSHDMCGPHALSFLAHVLLAVDLPWDVAELNTLRVNMRASFVQAMYERSTCICPLIWARGGTGALLKSLSEELCVRGVPADVAETRASDAIRTLGSEQVLQAMQQKQPWKHLKTLANQARFKFVLPAELAAAVAANKGRSVGQKSPKKPAVGISAPVALDPSKLVVLEGTFRCQSQVLPQLHAQQVGPLSSGFVLMTLSDASPYIKTGRVVSQEPLALIVFHQADQAIECVLPQSRVTVPCRCTVDNEPVLAEATMLQIGTGVVEKFTGDAQISLDSPDVRSIRIAVFRDEVADWDGFVKAPVRNVVACLPELQRCFTVGCQCQAWHNEE